MLARFKPVPLLDQYDVYEQLMSYWHSGIHDDVFLIMNEGWLAAAKPRLAIEDKDRKLSEAPDLVIGSGRKAQKYKMDLVPPALMVDRYLAEDQAKVDNLTATAEEASRALEEYIEEHAVEDGLLAEAMDDDKVSKSLASARLRVVKREKSDPNEIKALEQVVKRFDAEAATKRAVKEAQAKLDLATIEKYGELDEDDVKDLVLDAKWLATIVSRIEAEVKGLTLALVDRIQELGDRYDETVADLDAELEKLEAKVAGHLASMGVKS